MVEPLTIRTHLGTSNMRIHKITKLNYASFDEFNWSNSVSEFDNINIMLGWNGSGKTVISKTLRTLETGQVNGHEFKIEITTETKKESYTEKSSLDNLGNKIRVFNEDYVEDVLRASDKIPHVFHVGKGAVDYSKEETELTAKKEELKEAPKCTEEHDQIASDVAEDIRLTTSIGDCIKDLTPTGVYNSYRKGDFEKRVKWLKDILKTENGPQIDDYTKAEKDIKEALVQAASFSMLEQNGKDITEAANWIIEKSGTINTYLAATPQQRLSERIGAMPKEEERWVKDGFELHLTKDNYKETCLFCGSNITNEKELTGHFSQEVIKLSTQINGIIHETDNHKTTLEGLSGKAIAKQKEKATTLINVLGSLSKKLQAKLDSIANKQKPMDVSTVPPIIDNQEQTDTTDLKNSLAREIECHYVAKNFEKYCKQMEKYQQCIEHRDTLENEIEVLQEKVDKSKAQAQNTHEAAEKLSRIFRITFPHRKITLCDNDEHTGYILKRNDKVCDFNVLSEGERNFIALAYFIISLENSIGGLQEEGLVVIDDPVSSLDKNSIFQIFSLIVDAIDKCSKHQYILLTHNLDFFGHLREHYMKKINASNGCQLYSVALSNQGSRIDNISPLLKDYKSDYYYVFGVLYAHKYNCSLEDAYLIVNLLRRWLETFLGFKFPPKTDLRKLLNSAYKAANSLDKSFQYAPNEMYRFITHGSHGFAEPEGIDESLLNGAQQRICEAIELVKILDKLHYCKLLKSVLKAAEVKKLHTDLSQLITKTETNLKQATKTTATRGRGLVDKAKQAETNLGNVAKALKAGKAEDLDQAVKQAKSAAKSLTNYLKK